MTRVIIALARLNGTDWTGRKGNSSRANSLASHENLVHPRNRISAPCFFPSAFFFPLVSNTLTSLSLFSYPKKFTSAPGIRLILLEKSIVPGLTRFNWKIFIARLRDPITANAKGNRRFQLDRWIPSFVSDCNLPTGLYVDATKEEEYRETHGSITKTHHRVFPNVSIRLIYSDTGPS